MSGSVTRLHVVREARTWLGTRVDHQGRVKGEYCDCIGPVVGVAQALGLTTYDRTDYSVRPDPEEMQRELDAHADRVSPADWRPADIAWCRHLGLGGPSTHLGILTCPCVDDRHPGGRAHAHRWSILHADPSPGIERVVEHRLDDAMRHRVRRVYRFRGLAE